VCVCALRDGRGWLKEAQRRGVQSALALGWQCTLANCKQVEWTPKRVTREETSDVRIGRMTRIAVAIQRYGARDSLVQSWSRDGFLDALWDGTGRRCSGQRSGPKEMSVVWIGGGRGVKQSAMSGIRRRCRLVWSMRLHSIMDEV
jgi:hypothetical protein